MTCTSELRLSGDRSGLGSFDARLADYSEHERGNLPPARDELLQPPRSQQSKDRECRTTVFIPVLCSLFRSIQVKVVTLTRVAIFRGACNTRRTSRRYLRSDQASEIMDRRLVSKFVFLFGILLMAAAFWLVPGPAKECGNEVGPVDEYRVDTEDHEVIRFEQLSDNAKGVIVEALADPAITAQVYSDCIDEFSYGSEYQSHIIKRGDTYYHLYTFNAANNGIGPSPGLLLYGSVGVVGFILVLTSIALLDVGASADEGESS